MGDSLMDAGARAVYDVRNLDALRGQVRRAPQSEEAQRQVAREFEALFINMMIQRMREATPREGLFDSAQSRMAQSLADQQMATQLADPGIGLAQALLQQMRQGMGQVMRHEVSQGSGQAIAGAGTASAARTASAAGAEPARTLAQLATRRGMVVAEPALAARNGGETSEKSVLGRARQFVSRLLPMATRVAQASGIPVRLMLGQAALESGWGQREIRHADGTPSHNLFGIKATSGWNGKVAEVVTTEYEQGTPRHVRQTFRAYASYAEAFADYARLIGGNSRYAEVLRAADHNDAARRIQKAGYATDPAYAEKLIKVMSQLGQ